MKIMFLLRKLNCNDGIAAYCETLATGLGGKGVAVDLVVGEVRVDAASLPRLVRLKAAVARWTELPNLTKFPSPGLMRRIALSWGHGGDVINVHGLGMLAWGRALATLMGRPLVATYHPSATGDLETARARTTTGFGFQQRLFLRLFRPDGLIAVSSSSAETLIQDCPSLKGRISVVPGGIDVHRFRAPTASERQKARSALGYEDGALVCLLIGRLSFVKGHDVLIHAARRVRAEQPDCEIRCVFAGTGPWSEEIRALALQDGDDEKTFQFVGHRDAREMYWAADILVLPSRVEGFPLVVAEGMATGLPAIRTPAGGASDQIIEGETGMIVPFNDPDALATAIMELSDPVRRTRMGLKAAEFARTSFSIDTATHRTLAVYEGLALRRENASTRKADAQTPGSVRP